MIVPRWVSGILVIASMRSVIICISLASRLDGALRRQGPNDSILSLATLLHSKSPILAAVLRLALRRIFLGYPETAAERHAVATLIYRAFFEYALIQHDRENQLVNLQDIARAELQQNGPTILEQFGVEVLQREPVSTVLARLSRLAVFSDNYPCLLYTSHVLSPENVNESRYL